MLEPKLDTAAHEEIYQTLKSTLHAASENSNHYNMNKYCLILISYVTLTVTDANYYVVHHPHLATAAT